MNLKNWWQTKPGCHWKKYSINTGIILLIMYNIAFWLSVFSGEKCGGDMGCSDWLTIFFVPTWLISPIIMIPIMILPDPNVVSVYIISTLGNLFLGFIGGFIVWKIKNRNSSS